MQARVELKEFVEPETSERGARVTAQKARLQKRIGELRMPRGGFILPKQVEG